MTSFSLTLQNVTPILGGAAKTRVVDRIDVIRAPTIRGHLRFWWRALYGHDYDCAVTLYEAESALWGRSADKCGGRSAVEIKTVVNPESIGEDNIDRNDISMKRTDGYVLWPARAEKGSDPAERWKIGVRFDLQVKCCRDGQQITTLQYNKISRAWETEVRNSLRAWILFGGYGSRTRRGVGSLTIPIDDFSDDDPTEWLPDLENGKRLSQEFVRLFGRNVLSNGSRRIASDLPLLAGASLFIGKPRDSSIDAWLEALSWLRDFRQGCPERTGEIAEDYARCFGSDNRPGKSNWPEADKVRWLSIPKDDLPWAHLPRYNADPAWPRAGFGLPIIGQFQMKNRNGTRWDYIELGNERRTEPEEFHIQWESRNAEGKACLHDRLASPLILKPLPLANGRFVPCALWLFRSYPESGQVVLVRDDQPVPNSGAGFDKLVGAGEKPLFTPLKGKASLKAAFLGWLADTDRAKRVAL
jgi:CRISPR-associated protein Cmr1